MNELDAYWSQSYSKIRNLAKSKTHQNDSEDVLHDAYLTMRLRDLKPKQVRSTLIFLRRHRVRDFVYRRNLIAGVKTSLLEPADISAPNRVEVVEMADEHQEACQRVTPRTYGDARWLEILKEREACGMNGFRRNAFYRKHFPNQTVESGQRTIARVQNRLAAKGLWQIKK